MLHRGPSAGAETPASSVATARGARDPYKARRLTHSNLCRRRTHPIPRLASWPRDGGPDPAPPLAPPIPRPLQSRRHAIRSRLCAAAKDEVALFNALVSYWKEARAIPAFSAQSARSPT